MERERERGREKKEDTKTAATKWRGSEVIYEAE